MSTSLRVSIIDLDISLSTRVTPASEQDVDALAGREVGELCLLH